MVRTRNAGSKAKEVKAAAAGPSSSPGTLRGGGPSGGPRGASPAPKAAMTTALLAAAGAPTATGTQPLASGAKGFTALPRLSDLELEGKERSMIPLQKVGAALQTAEGAAILTELQSDFVDVRTAPHGMAVLDIKSTGGAVAVRDYLIGQLQCSKFVCSARKKIWWMVPSWGTEAADLQPETQFLLVEGKEASGRPVYYGLFPLICSDGVFRGTLRPGRKAQGVDMQGRIRKA